MSAGALGRRTLLLKSNFSRIKSVLTGKGASNSLMSTPVRIMSRLVETVKADHVTMIAVNRPEVRNCVDAETATQLYDAFQEFERDENAHVAVFYGKGGVFCAGYDLNSLAKTTEQPSNFNGEPRGENEPGPMGPSRMMFSKPVIAAVEGFAVAGGLELSLMCDMRVVDEAAVMGVFCRRFGVPLLDGGTARLPQLIGLSRALDLILTGRPVHAAEALQIGLANRVTKPGAAVGVAMDIALQMCNFPQGCLRSDRRAAYHSAYDAASITDALRYEYNSGIQHVAEAVMGAKNFSSGAGRHGSFEDDFSLEKYSRSSPTAGFGPKGKP